MGINSKIAKIPFWGLYLILAALTAFNWLRVILFQADFEAFRHTQPWDYYLSRLFADTFGTTQKQYFIFALPVVLIFLDLVPKLFGKLISLDKGSNVKGDNHVAILLMFLFIPSVFNFQALFGLAAPDYLTVSVLMIGIFSLLSWLDERQAKTKT
ncbi:hypothetical protein M1523_03400 [Patescibacteria group bacterium]|nr:hypothetical protein [Patescibacteria group bacterium]MCL5091232.1 hypothetical protein [Patescibacteria group bacterium]